VRDAELRSMAGRRSTLVRIQRTRELLRDAEHLGLALHPSEAHRLASLPPGRAVVLVRLLQREARGSRPCSG
jgi:hypothetical protein